MWWDSISGAIPVVTFMVTVIAAAVWLRSALVKQRHSELAELAYTRAERIDDLEKELRQMETRLATLEGAYAGLQAMKATEIAEEVIARLTPHLSKMI